MINASDEVWERYINLSQDGLNSWVYNHWWSYWKIWNIVIICALTELILVFILGLQFHLGCYKIPKVSRAFTFVFFFQDDIYFIAICTLNHVSWILLIQESAQNKNMVLMSPRYFAIDSVLYALKIQLCNNMPLVHRDTARKLLWVCTWKAAHILRNFNKFDKTSGNTLSLRET